MKDPNPRFKEGEILYNQYVVGASFISDLNKKKISLTCLICGATFFQDEIRVVNGTIRCTGCRKIRYEQVVKEANAISHRVCRGCKKLLPKESFRPRIGCTNYINPWCRECEVARFKHPENLPDPVTGLKRCALCKEALPLSRFAAHPHHPDGLKSWCEKCNRTQYHQSLIRRGLRPSEEERAKAKEEKQRIRQLREEEKEEKRLKREAEKAQFKKDKAAFFEDPENKRKQYLFDFWKKGYYN